MISLVLWYPDRSQVVIPSVASDRHDGADDGEGISKQDRRGR